ncbi:hypothetical protein EB001_26730 [bacterium]|nr:hypothetical protein [bacterium]
MAHFNPVIVEEVTTIARNFLRDFPKFFQTSFEATTRTYELGHPNIDTDSVYIAIYTSSTPTELAASAFSLDARNGILRLTSTPAANSSLMVEGYHYEWILPADLEFYAHHAIEEHVYNLSTPLENMSAIVIDTIGMATVVNSLWALLSEYSRDIDVMTSESVHIPGSQRFRMVQSLLEYWQAQYEKQARALNIGVNRIEVMNLSRVSRITNRYVPIYRARELGDYGPIERVFPERDKGTIEVEDKGDDLREDVFVDTNPPSSLYNTGFF